MHCILQVSIEYWSKSDVYRLPCCTCISIGSCWQTKHDALLLTTVLRYGVSLNAAVIEAMFLSKHVCANGYHFAELIACVLVNYSTQAMRDSPAQLFALASLESFVPGCKFPPDM